MSDAGQQQQQQQQQKQGGEGDQQQQQQQQQQPAFAPEMRTAFFKALTPDNLSFAERNGYYKPDGSHMADPNVIFDSYRNADKMLGTTRLPDPDMSNDEALGKWPGWQKLGVATKPEDIKVERPQLPNGMKWKDQGDPNGIEWDAAGETRMKQLLVLGHVPQKFHQQILNAEVEARVTGILQQQNDVKMQTQNITTALTKELGASFDAKRTQAWAAVNFIAKAANIDPKQLADENSVLMGGEAMARAWIKIGEMLGEDKLKGALEGGFASGPSAAQAELDRLKTDPEHQKALMDKTHPGHKAAVDREETLQKTIHG